MNIVLNAQPYPANMNNEMCKAAYINDSSLCMDVLGVKMYALHIHAFFMSKKEIVYKCIGLWQGT